ncbi:mechanosensitive ion channel [Balneolales bacterium ANBcel1]|nr:mechanosensitive ion channel [Balneolales bacterium ANBcel1]
MNYDLQAGEINEIIAEQVIPYGLNVLGAIAILIIGWLVAGWVGKRLGRVCETSPRVDDTLAPLIAKTAKMVILFATLIAVLAQFGFETTSLVALLGAAGLTIGLAMQGTLSNVASGVMLLSFRPFENGDFVNIGGSIGIVDEIGLFMTKMHTLDNIFVILPNSRIWGSEIMNYSRNETRRVDMVFSISYRDDIDKAMKVVKEVLDEEPRVLKTPEPLIAVGKLGDNSVDLLVRPWTKTSDFWMTMLDLTKLVKQRFDKEGITIPFPQRDVHLHNSSLAEKMS